jgi:hypothetical protein
MHRLKEERYRVYAVYLFAVGALVALVASAALINLDAYAADSLAAAHVRAPFSLLAKLYLPNTALIAASLYVLAAVAVVCALVLLCLKPSATERLRGVVSISGLAYLVAWTHLATFLVVLREIT